MYDAFLGAHGRVHGSVADYQQRAEIFARNAELVDAHNGDESKSFQLELNRFADMAQVRPIPGASVGKSSALQAASCKRAWHGAGGTLIREATPLKRSNECVAFKKWWPNGWLCEGGV